MGEGGRFRLECVLVDLLGVASCLSPWPGRSCSLFVEDVPHRDVEGGCDCDDSAAAFFLKEWSIEANSLILVFVDIESKVSIKQ